MMDQHHGGRLLEGTDQRGLFVEIWEAVADFAQFKHERLEQKQSEWGVLLSYVDGGKDKIHIWEFTEIT